MFNTIRIISITYFFSFCIGCKVEQKADLILYNGEIYTADSTHQIVEAMAITGQWIIAIGDSASVFHYKGTTTQCVDLKNQFVMPGLIEGHGHYIGLGKSLLQLNLIHTQSWDEIVDSVKNRVATAQPDEWIEGRGWHQEKWKSKLQFTVSGYPSHDELSAISPKNPVVLFHASGHGLIANEKAMKIAGISPETKNPSGGRILKNIHGQAIGVFEENAMSLIVTHLNDFKANRSKEINDQIFIRQAKAASNACLHYGITSFHDAGSSLQTLLQLQQLSIDNTIAPRIYAMLNEDDFGTLKRSMDSLPIPLDAHHKFQCQSVKAYVDGALGSYGAWLFEPYEDKHDHTGQNTLPLQELENIAVLCKSKNLQLCVHGIGDKGNHEILSIFSKVLEETNSSRWRIEHAQHLHPADFSTFKTFNVIASMQAIHCTSDAPFVVKRLGEKRAREGAYVWRSLLNAKVRLANGTDCPVESLNPFECMFAAVTRKRLDNGMEFFPEQKMTRKEALHSYTLWNAYAAFEENSKGSIEKGKLADFIILDRSLLQCKDIEIPQTRVLSVYIGGKKLQ